MNNKEVVWKKVDPTELSEETSAGYFALAKNDRFFLVNKVYNSCLFTSVIQASSCYSCSIYDIDIWVGSTYGFKGNDESDSDMELAKASLAKTLTSAQAKNIFNPIVSITTSKLERA